MLLISDFDCSAILAGQSLYQDTHMSLITNNQSSKKFKPLRLKLTLVHLFHLKVLWRFNTTDKSQEVVSDEHPGSGDRPMLLPRGDVTWTENAAR